MKTDTYPITPMTPEHAREICRWQYPGPYAFYDHSAQTADNFMDGTHFACTDPQGALIGYFCFGEDARIPTEETAVYTEDCLDIGLGLRPDLCGQGLGLPFLCLGLDYARGALGAAQFRLSVACFNQRAITVYERAGFRVEREVTNAYFKNKFIIMRLG